MKHILSVLFAFVLCTAAENNGLGRTPQMGWNSWNSFGCNINETLFREVAKIISSSGLGAAGYEYVNMDDCWAGSRNASGYIEPTPSQFPSGVKALADYVHGLNLKFGLYSDAGTNTCAGRPGSLGYETQDATQYAAWGVDYLKYDDCNTGPTPDLTRYTAMSKALNETGRSIFFSLCNGQISTATWAPVLGNSWRTTTDIEAVWESIMNNIDQSDYVAKYAGPGGWNDPDMLEVGNGALTNDENMAHFSLWALAKAPLILGNVLSDLTPEVLQVLTNKDVIAVNQDPLGVQGVKLATNVAQDSSIFDPLLILAPCQGLPSQKFVHSSSNLTLTSAMNGHCVWFWADGWGCHDSWTGAGQHPYLIECNQFCGGNRTAWKIEANSTHAGQIRTFFMNQDVNLCLSTGNANGNAQSAIAWGCDATDPDQQWTFGDDGTIKSQDGQCLTVSGGQEVWGGPLSGNQYAAVLFNRAQQSQNITVTWSQLGLSDSTQAHVRDLWSHEDLGVFSASYSTQVNPHGASMIRITPN